jgi:hypothetical protein
MQQHLEEKAILDYLKTWPNSFVSMKEVARKSLGRKRYEEDPGWALPILAQMVRMGTVETDHLGYYRLVMEKKKDQKQKHVSPQILRILKSSGKSFEAIVIDDDDDGPIPTYGQPAPPGSPKTGRSGGF